MEFNYNIEGGNFSRAGTASSEVKKILKQLNVNPAVLKRIVVALYEAEVNAVSYTHLDVYKRQAFKIIALKCSRGNERVPVITKVVPAN